MRSVFGLRQDKVEVDGTCDTNGGEDQEAVSVQAFLQEEADSKETVSLLLANPPDSRSDFIIPYSLPKAPR